MKETLRFLQDLSLNNNKEWFNANKDRYLAAKASVDALAADLLNGLRGFDDTIGPMSPKDCTYRIYRDLRFSKDKTPYKTHLGIYINRGGKKSGYSGYYFHVGASEYGNMIAIGDIWCPPEVLKVIREDIQLGGGDFRKILSEVDSRLVIDERDALKRVPVPFPSDTPDAPYYKLKAFCLYYAPDNRFVTGKDLASRLVDIYHTAKPFLDYINRAIDFVREEKKEYFSSLVF
ncbi:MAG: DUF2461 domain-containing protein [Bacteroidales bacterium]|nr:DUF2461 domain-containing protein [Bacteroidales bacterium]